MPTPVSGPIKFSDLAILVFNNPLATVSLGNTEIRAVGGSTTGPVSMSSMYNKPTAGNTGTTYYTAGNYSWIVVPYQTLSVTVAGGGGAGGGYGGGQLIWNGYFFQCVNQCYGGNGAAGSQSSFNGVIAYGGTGGLQAGGGNGTDGGNNQNGNTGGGGAFGAGNSDPVDTNCEQASGGNGGAGGYVQKSWTKFAGGPSFGSTINFTVGAGGPMGPGGCRGQAGAAGGSGYVKIEWS